MLGMKLDREHAVELLLNAGANPNMKDKLGQEVANYKYSMTRTDVYAAPITKILQQAKENYPEKRKVQVEFENQIKNDPFFMSTNE